MAKGKKLTQNVNKDKFFNDLPDVHPLISSWLSRHTNYQSSNLGRIVPIYYDEILPNEEREIRMAMTSHTTTPIAPIFNSLYTEIRSFFVPMRLAADLLNGYKTRKSPWVKVFGEDNASEDSKVIVALDEQSLPTFTVDHQFIQDLGDYDDSFDTYDNVFDSLDLNLTVGSSHEQNFLNLAAYELIYQRHYRNENYEAASSSPLYRLLFDAYNENKASSELLPTFTYEIANREKDYFTGMKPFTQKGDPVTINIGQSADVKLKDSFKIGSKLESGDISQIAKQKVGVEGAYGDAGSQIIGLHHKELLGDEGNFVDAVDFNAAYFDPNGTMYADLSSLQGISIEQLRVLIKTQELLEKDAMYGSRYAESLNSHFGCCPLDETLQDPAELYKVTITSNMQAIFQTSSTSGESSILGTIGANSTTQTDPFVILPKTKFKEHGILMICAVHKLQNVYDTRFFKPKFNFKHKRFDFYTPELNDLGFQPVEGGKEMMLASGDAGFNEAFAEYRYKFNKCHGSLNEDFPYWAPSIAGEYETAASLYKESTEILDKALSVRSESAPQFYDAWGFEETNTKPMSLHSIPGFDGVI